MRPVPFPQQTVELQKPAGMTDEQCGALPVFRDGTYCISCWSPSWRDRLRLALGGPVWLWIWAGQTQPPVSLTLESPFVERVELPWYERLALRLPYFRKRWLTFGLVLLAVGCTPKIPPQPPGLPCGGSCPPNLTCKDGKCVDACAGVTCPPGVPCRDGLCHAIPPPPEDTSKAPPAPIGLDTLVRQEGGKLMRGGQPWVMKLAIPCWSDIENRLFIEGPTPEGIEIPYLWPLPSPEWMEYAGSKGWNAGEARPYYRDPCCGLESIGGPYLYPSGEWNPEWWKKYHQVQHAATALKWSLIVDVADGWTAKHCIWGEEKLCPFVSEQDNHNFFAVPLNPSLKKWIAKLVSETENYGGVIWQISNESEQARFDDAPSWSAEWEQAMHGEIRANEKNVVHVIASNTRDYGGPYDLFTAHTLQMIEGPVAGRPLVVNEYNPHLSPSQFKAFHCKAIAVGQTFGYWRSDGKLADQTGSINVDCAAPPSCPDPKPDRSKLTFSIKCENSGVCDATPLVTNACDYCASIGMGTGPGGTIRCGCPMRNECPGTPGYEGMCQDRLPCEQYVLSVPGKSVSSPVWDSDGQVVPADEFGFRVYCNGCSYLRACNADKSICKDAPIN